MEKEYSWDTEGIFPGKPAHDEAWEAQRKTLLAIIRNAVFAGMPNSKAFSIAFAWDRKNGMPFSEIDVQGMVNWTVKKVMPGTAGA